MLTSTRSAPLNVEFSLVDAGAIEAFFSSRGDVNWPGGGLPSEVHIERVWPVGRDEIAVEWSFLLENRERVSLHALPRDSRDCSLPSLQEPSLCNGVLRGLRFALPERELEIHSIDCDSVLTALPECLDAEAMARHLEPYLSTGERHPDRRPSLEVHPLSYRARRRATIRYRHDHQRLIGKVFRDDRGIRAERWHLALRERLSRSTHGQVTVPIPVGYLADVRMLLFGWSEPRELPASAASAAEVRTVMHALAALHQVAMDDLPAYSAADEIAIVERWARALATIAPDRTDTLRRLIPVWRVQSPPSHRRVTLHRDFYSRQVLLGAKQTTIIDLDTLSGGDAAVDVGNFLAHRWLDSLRHAGGFSAERFEQESREVLIAYQSSGGRLRRSNVRWYWASALLRLGAVHALRTTTGRYSDALWALSAQLLGVNCVLDQTPRMMKPDLGLPQHVEAILSEVRE